jgi:hypothetical protein
MWGSVQNQNEKSAIMLLSSFITLQNHMKTLTSLTSDREPANSFPPSQDKGAPAPAEPARAPVLPVPARSM